MKYPLSQGLPRRFQFDKRCRYENREYPPYTARCAAWHGTKEAKHIPANTARCNIRPHSIQYPEYPANHN